MVCEGVKRGRGGRSPQPPGLHACTHARMQARERAPHLAGAVVLRLHVEVLHQRITQLLLQLVRVMVCARAHGAFAFGRRLRRRLLLLLPAPPACPCCPYP